MADGPAAGRHIVLVGLPGVGKSTVGRRLAKEVGRPFADVDEQIELAAGATIPAIFAARGEAEFRRLEAAVVADLTGRASPLVIAAGGGVVTVDANRARLEGACVIWLRASAAFLARRTDPTHRPLLAGDARAALARLAAERAPLYASVADLAVDVEGFHAAGDKPKRALARHLAALVAAPARVGS